MDRFNFFTKKYMKKISKDNFKKTLSTFATGITVVGTQGSAGAYQEIVVSDTTPTVLPVVPSKRQRIKKFLQGIN